MEKRKFLVKGPISPDLIAGYLNKLGERKNTGGHSIFLGQVRDDMTDGKMVSAIEYSAYNDMVEKEACRIIEITRGAFNDIKDIVIIHSTGLVKTGAISLFVLVTAGHRDHAIRGCRHVLEMIKEYYPVWKKEIFEDSTHKWKDQ